MRKTAGRTMNVAVILALAMSAASARDAARDLRRMVGYTIVDATWVSKVSRNSVGDKYVETGDGNVYRVDFLLLDPLPLTDVIVFAKPPSQEIRDAFRDRLPEYMLWQYKLLMDNEAYDAMPVR